MTVQLLGWLGQVDAVLLAANSVLNHLFALIMTLVGGIISVRALWRVLRPAAPIGAKRAAKVTRTGKRPGKRRPRPNNPT